MLYGLIFAFLLVSSGLVQEATCAKGETSLVNFQPIFHQQCMLFIIISCFLFPQESNYNGKKSLSRLFGNVFLLIRFIYSSTIFI